MQKEYYGGTRKRVIFYVISHINWQLLYIFSPVTETTNGPLPWKQGELPWSEEAAKGVASILFKISGDA